MRHGKEMAVVSLGLMPLSRSEELELLDKPGHAPDLLAGNLADLQRVNRWLGGVSLTLRGICHLTGHLSAGAQLCLLDVATGGADVPMALRRWAARRGIHLQVVAIDLSPEILRYARRQTDSRVHLVTADAAHLPFVDRSFDVAMCSLTLHHFAPETATAVLREMARVSARGIVVNDLLRCWHGYWGARLLSRVLTRNPLTRHDAPLSVRRAYTRHELQCLAAQAGIGSVVFEHFLRYRVAMTGAAGVGT